MTNLAIAALSSVLLGLAILAFRLTLANRQLRQENQTLQDRIEANRSAQRSERDHLLDTLGDGFLLVDPDRFIRSFEEGLEQVEIELWQQRDLLAELTREFSQSVVQWRETLSEWAARLHVHSLLNDVLSRF